jgi:hypothetical protein
MKRFLLTVLLFSAATLLMAGNTITTVGQVTDAVSLTDDVDYVITGTQPFTTTGSVDIINTEHAVVIFSNLKPSVVIKSHLSGVYIHGEAARNNVNCQVKMYAQGSIVLPYGKDFKPLTVWSEPNFSGDSTSDFGLENSGGYMNTLSAAKLNNRIRSFRLKRGYMVTFALGTGGWGYSRCFIADSEDLEMAVMPENMDSRISSYRLFVWQNAQKKGLASDTRAEANGALNASWCYTWSTGENRYPDTECVPNHIYEDWPSSSACGSVTHSCHLKTNNEPGNPADDHPQDVATVLNNWQNLMRTGLRLCSETSHDGSWYHLQEFIREIDARGWRCDILDLHCYWGAGSFGDFSNFYNDYGKRPIWISEWVWGASWNRSNWSSGGIFAQAPDGPDSFSERNQQKCYDGTVPILEKLNASRYVERYAYWNSEADCSKIYKDGKLSILGRYYADMKSGLGYNAEIQKIPTVVYTSPTELTGTLTRGRNTYALKWYDSNGDMADSMVVECRRPGSSRFEWLANIPLKDRTNARGSSYSYTDTLMTAGTWYYRVGVYPIGKTAARYSGTVTVSVNRSEGDDIIQYGSVTAASTDYTFTDFATSFESAPVVLFGPITYNNNTTPLCHHLYSVKKDGFQYRFFPWSLSGEQTMTYEDRTDFIAVRRGNGEAGGLRYEATQVATTQMDSAFYVNAYGKVNNDTARIRFNQPFEPGDTPVVFVNVLTTRETYPLMWKVFDVDNEGFKIRLCREFGREEKVFFAESVLYLAIEQGSGQLSEHKRITVGRMPDAVGGIIARTVAYGDTLVRPLYWGEPQTARESKAAITRLTSLYDTGARIRRLIDTSEKSTSSKVYEDFGWMVISDGQLPSSIGQPTERATETIDVEWYSLDGRQTPTPTPGHIYLRRSTDGKGRTKTEKIIYH